ncbi:hypothetical protein [Actinoplanes sp. NPDC049681]|uniref:hypothetical protein n=1 Tax=Actinoplanes sp. NPDC049681 TaxID=3363905 RepID=UPI003798EDD2
MSTFAREAEGPTRDDLRVLIGILSNVEAALTLDGPAEVMEHLLARLRRDLRSAGLLRSDDPSEAISAVAGMNARLRVAVGEVSPE